MLFGNKIKLYRRWFYLSVCTCVITVFASHAPAVSAHFPAFSPTPSPTPAPSLASNSASVAQAQALDIQAHQQRQSGQTEAALYSWQQAAEIYQAHPATLDITEALIRNQINQAQALRSLGYYHQAHQRLAQLVQDFAELPPSELKVATLHSLGVTLRIAGDFQQSQTIIEQALVLASSLQTGSTDRLNLSLAKTLAALGELDQALTLLSHIQSGDAHRQAPRLQLETALFQLKIWQQQHKLEQVFTTLPVIQAQLMAQPASRWSIYAQVKLADIAMSLGSAEAAAHPNSPALDPLAIAKLLRHAIAQSQDLSDRRAQSYALGQLGHLYEQTTQVTDALVLTQQSLTLAQQLQATDLIAKWQWQQGRLLSQQGNVEAAIESYTAAVSYLEVLQEDLVNTDPEIQFSFQDQAEPVYRQLIDLLLADVDNLSSEKQQQQRLTQAVSIAEALQLAEIQNYFREACLTYQTRAIETIDPQAAVVYPILLSERLEVIVSIPGLPLKHHAIDFQSSDQAAFLNDFYWRLNPLYEPTEILPLSQKLYDWMIRPVASAFEQQTIETLVFVPDLFLRGLPMSLLHDGDHYLVEKYQIALTPGMQLLNAQPIDPRRLSALTMGLSQSREGFNALPAVEQELDKINTLVNAKTLLNEAFTKANFFNQVENNPINIVHIATHGQFSSAAADTFVLAWDDRINVRELDRLFQRQAGGPADLLVLSACQTASGDDRAALGIAGMAVRSGARSTVASLWSVADNSTAEFMREFYAQLTQPGTSRAEALRLAQLSLIHSTEHNHPYYWAPFVLVGNWQ